MIRLVKQTKDDVVIFYLINEDNGVILNNSIPADLISDPRYTSATRALHIVELVRYGIEHNLIEIPEITDYDFKRLQTEMATKKAEGDFK